MATDVERLVVQLEANMRGYERAMQRVIGQTNRSAQRIEQRFERANRTVERGFAMMGRAAVSSLAAIGAAVGTAQLAKLAQDALAAAEGIADTGDRVGFAVERLQELRFAADQNGSSARTLDMALQRFSRRVGEAVNGTGELRDTLIQNRIQLRDTNGQMRDSYDILLDYADAIQNAESEQEALRMAFKAFDSEGAQLVTLMRQGREGIDRFATRARELGMVLEEDLVREGAEANRVIRNMRQEISGEFNRAVLENADSLVTMAGALGQVAAAAIRATGALIDMFKDPEGSANITAEIEQLEARLRTLRAGGARVEQIAGIEQRLESLRGQLSIALNFEAFQDWWESQADEPPAPPLTPRGGAGGGASDGPLEPLPAPVRVGDRPGTSGGPGGLMPSDSDIDKITTFFAEELGDKTVDAIEAERERIAYAFENGFRAASQGGMLNFFAQNLRSAVFESVSQGLSRAFAESLSGNVFGSLFSGLFTGSFSGRGKLPFGGGKAAGGPVDAGRSYRVGERGPETFVPLQRGMIVPNGAALQASRGVTVVNQFHLHAEGAVMTDELLAEMDQKAMAAAQGAVAITRRDMAGARDRASKRLR